jgi:hypothetical protein
MTFRKLILLLALVFSFAVNATAEEVNLETNISLITPYDKVTSGLGGTWRPEIFSWGRLSLGLGMVANISSRFYYETTPALPIPDSSISSGWKYTNDNHLEVADFDFHLEGRYQVLGDYDNTKWKGWLTLTLGEVINTGAITQYQSHFRDSANYMVQGPITYITTYTSPTRVDAYISPGFLVGIGNFTVGYRQWFYFDNFDIRPGEAGRLRGSLRIGYRFQW